MKKYLLIMIFITSSLFADKELPWLSVNNTHIQDSTGKRVILRGVNLGSWLVPEMWMLPIKTHSSKAPELGKIKDHTSLWGHFEKRFGKDKMQEIRYEFRKAWITEKDFERIRKMGFNCVRVPFLYDLLDEPEGFFWLDFAINAAKKQGLYVIIDLHGAIGRQSANDHTGHSEQDRFFKEPDFWEKTAKLWARVAMRYKDCPEVAGYDLLNEPQGAPSNKLLYKVQDKLYRRIRRIDTRHLIFIEDGFKSIKFMPHKNDYGWKNAVLSTHMYCHESHSKGGVAGFFDRKIQEASREYKSHKLPYFMGEFNVKPYGKLEDMKKTLSHMNQNRIAYCLWSYKIAPRSGGYSLWGLYVGGKGVSTIDPFSDSYKDILKKMSRLTTERFTKNELLVELFTHALAETDT